jgi:hypothetical protein
MSDIDIDDDVPDESPHTGATSGARVSSSGWPSGAPMPAPLAAAHSGSSGMTDNEYFSAHGSGNGLLRRSQRVKGLLALGIALPLLTAPLNGVPLLKTPVVNEIVRSFPRERPADRERSEREKSEREKEKQGSKSTPPLSYLEQALPASRRPYFLDLESGIDKIAIPSAPSAPSPSFDLDDAYGMHFKLKMEAVKMFSKAREQKGAQSALLMRISRFRLMCSRFRSCFVVVPCSAREIGRGRVSACG